MIQNRQPSKMVLGGEYSGYNTVYVAHSAFTDADVYGKAIWVDGARQPSDTNLDRYYLLITGLTPETNYSVESAYYDALIDEELLTARFGVSVSDALSVNTLAHPTINQYTVVADEVDVGVSPPVLELELSGAADVLEVEWAPTGTGTWTTCYAGAFASNLRIPGLPIGESLDFRIRGKVVFPSGHTEHSPYDSIQDVMMDWQYTPPTAPSNISFTVAKLEEPSERYDVQVSWNWNKLEGANVREFVLWRIDAALYDSNSPTNRWAGAEVVSLGTGRSTVITNHPYNRAQKYRVAATAWGPEGDSVSYSGEADFIIDDTTTINNDFTTQTGIEVSYAHIKGLLNDNGAWKQTFMVDAATGNVSIGILDNDGKAPISFTSDGEGSGTVNVSGEVISDTIYSANFVLSNLNGEGSPAFRSDGKLEYGDPSPGIWMGHEIDGDYNFKFDLGDSLKYIRWDGDVLRISGEVQIGTPGGDKPIYTGPRTVYLVQLQSAGTPATPTDTNYPPVGWSTTPPPVDQDTEQLWQSIGIVDLNSNVLVAGETWSYPTTTTGATGAVLQEQYRYANTNSGVGATNWGEDPRDTDFYRQSRILEDNVQVSIGSWHVWRKDGVDGINGSDGDTYREEARYSASSSGTNPTAWGDDPRDTDYFKQVRNLKNGSVISIGVWFRVRLDGTDGTDGADGSDGTNGIDGDTYQEQYRYSPIASSSGATAWGADPRASDYYRQSRVLKNGVQQSTGSWHLFRKDGVDGADGTNGTNGTDGDTYQEQYRYSNTASSTGATAWGADPRDTDYYRQARVLKNGIQFDTGSWHLFRKDGQDGSDGVNGSDGADGSDGYTYQEQYRYAATSSGTGATAWGADPRSTDYYRQARLLRDGAQVSLGSWHVIRKDGADGANGQDGSDGSDGYTYQEQYRYSSTTNGTDVTSWGADPRDSDYYRQTRLLRDGSQISIGSWHLFRKDGANGSDGDTYKEEARYAATSSGTGATAWGGDPRDTDYYKQLRTLKNGSVISTGSWRRIRLDGSDGDTYQEQSRYAATSSGASATAWGADPRNTDYFKQVRTLKNGSVISTGTWFRMRLDGVNGADGTDGTDGADGVGGPGFFSQPIAGFSGSFNSSSASAYVLAEVGRSPLPGDVVTQYNTTDVSVATTRKFNGVIWDVVALAVHGDMVVDGTILGETISSNTTITAGSEDNTVKMSGSDGTWRLAAGKAVMANAPFRVDKYGNVFAESGYFGGSVEAANMIGTPSAFADYYISRSFISPYSDNSFAYENAAIVTVQMDPLKAQRVTIQWDPYMKFPCSGSQSVWTHPIYSKADSWANSLIRVRVWELTIKIFLKKADGTLEHQGTASRPRRDFTLGGYNQYSGTDHLFGANSFVTSEPIEVPAGTEEYMFIIDLEANSKYNLFTYDDPMTLPPGFTGQAEMGGHMYISTVYVDDGHITIT